jgi:hypothetical protein
MNIPACPWRPARWFVTEFVRPFSPAILEQATALRKLVTTDDEYIKVCANYVRDNFTYPLEKNGDPSAGLVLKRYDKGCRTKRYFFNQEMDYAWGFPNETIKLKLGICIDTALLMTSLLIAGGVPAKVALGAVINNEDGSVAGYHAWSTFMFQDVKCADETTIHFKAETINKITSLYYATSDWSKGNGIHYRQDSDFDHESYDATTELGKNMVALMGLPAQRVDENTIQCYGINDILELREKKHKSITKEWRKAEIIKHKILSSAYGGG